MRYLTKDWYIACQTDPMTPEVQKRLGTRSTGRTAPRRRARRCRMDCYSGFSSMTVRCGRLSPEQTSRSASTARFLNTIP